MKHVIYTLLALFIASCTDAQPPVQPMYEVVVPGSDQINTGFLKPHEIKYSKPGAEMTYVMKEVTRNGKALYELAIYFNWGEGIPDLIYIDKETLGYSGRKMEMKDYILDVKFENNHFSGALEPTEGSSYNKVVYDKNYEHNAFEPAVINYFIAALPLKKGYKASIPVFDLNNGSEMYWSNIEVVGQEKVKIGDRTYDTWKVVSKGIKHKTIWVSTEVPYAIKMKTKGSGGTWKLVNE